VLKGAGPKKKSNAAGRLKRKGDPRKTCVLRKFFPEDGRVGCLMGGKKGTKERLCEVKRRGLLKKGLGGEEDETTQVAEKKGGGEGGSYWTVRGKIVFQSCVEK